MLDHAIIKIDQFLRSRNAQQTTTSARINPAHLVLQNSDLTVQERKASISMLRINHSGEICAQALYQGQAYTARSKTLAINLQQAALEEAEHLQWCQQRLSELNGRTSLLNPIWYAGSLAIGACAGIAGDKISLGFLAETEYQVTAHLDKHLSRISENDHKSRAILNQMRTDELQHAINAQQAGGLELPRPIKILMRCTAKILTATAGRI